MGKTRVRTSVVCLHNGKLLGFHAEDPSTKTSYIFLPGGKIESHETAPEAAERETLEETGFQVRVDPSSCVDKEYTFDWDGQDFDCLTMFYGARLSSPLQRTVQDTAYHKGVTWIPLADIPQVFSYSPAILEAIQEILQSQKE